ncbi:unnamed protein product [Clavelina lepadiformis]|uniref:Uncharacterized protein n=1 Tax=Clavelina lepadiformis TaxID=159417 RepID=A0ABP0GA07_CLALP
MRLRHTTGFFFRMRSAQAYSATNCSHLFPSSSGVFRSSWPMGGCKTRQSKRICSAVCDSAPQMHDDDVLRPQRCMHSPKRPTPVLRRFSVVQAFRGRSAPAGVVVEGSTLNWGGGGGGTSFQSSHHAVLMLKPAATSAAACLLKGRRETSR